MICLNEPLKAPVKQSRTAVILKRIGMGALLVVLGFVLLCFALLIGERVIGKKTIPTAFGFAPLTVLTGSMEPEIYAGDMVIIHRQKDYAVGDTVTYELAGGNASVTHEIIRTYVEGGVTYYITKGTNNNAEDPLPVAKSQVAGKVVFVIPGLGTFLEWLKTPAGLTLVLLFGCIIVAAVYIVRS